MDADWLSSVNWGDAPGWTAALAALAALYFARRASRTALDVYDLEKQREDRAEDAANERRAADERSAQADSVAAWCNFRGYMAPSRSSAPRWGVNVQNASALPIWEVVAEVYHPSGRKMVEMSFGLVPPGGKWEEWPRELRTRTEPSEDGDARRQRYEEAAEEFQVALTFVDSAGRMWRRSRHGTLSKTGTRIIADTAQDGRSGRARGGSATATVGRRNENPRDEPPAPVS